MVEPYRENLLADPGRPWNAQNVYVLVRYIVPRWKWPSEMVINISTASLGIDF